MMNEARIGVGAGRRRRSATPATSSRSTTPARGRRAARSAARTRAAPPVPIIEHADVRRMLLAQKALRRRRARRSSCTAPRSLDEQRTAGHRRRGRTRRLLLDVLTPIAKSWPSQWCLEANDLAIQVHGGYGYTREYDVEQHYRDNRLNPIHEGTHGIQALDLLGRKVVMARRGRARGCWRDAVRRTVAERASRRAAKRRSWRAELRRRARTGSSTTTPVLGADGDPAARWPTRRSTWRPPGTWWSRGSGSSSCSPPAIAKTPFHEGKRQAARYFFRFELPQTGPQLDLLARLDPTTSRPIRGGCDGAGGRVRRQRDPVRHGAARRPVRRRRRAARARPAVVRRPAARRVRAHGGGGVGAVRRARRGRAPGRAARGGAGPTGERRGRARPRRVRDAVLPSRRARRAARVDGARPAIGDDEQRGGRSRREAARRRGPARGVRAGAVGGGRGRVEARPRLLRLRGRGVRCGGRGPADGRRPPLGPRRRGAGGPAHGVGRPRPACRTRCGAARPTTSCRASTSWPTPWASARGGRAPPRGRDPG